MKIDVKQCVEFKQAFKTSNIEAYYIGKEYIITSYNTIIYSTSKGLNLKNYSATTSKLQKIISLVFYGVNFLECKRVKAINGKDYQKNRSLNND